MESPSPTPSSSQAVAGSAEAKKTRTRRKAFTESEDMVILRAVKKEGPYSVRGGASRTRWDSIAQIVTAEIGSAITPGLCKGRYENMMKQFELVRRGSAVRKKWPSDAELVQLLEEAAANRPLKVVRVVEKYADAIEVRRMKMHAKRKGSSEQYLHEDEDGRERAVKRLRQMLHHGAMASTNSSVISSGEDVDMSDEEDEDDHDDEASGAGGGLALLSSQAASVTSHTTRSDTTATVASKTVEPPPSTVVARAPTSSPAQAAASAKPGVSTSSATSIPAPAAKAVTQSVAPPPPTKANGASAYALIPLSQASDSFLAFHAAAGGATVKPVVNHRPQSTAVATTPTATQTTVQHQGGPYQRHVDYGRRSPAQSVNGTVVERPTTPAAQTTPRVPGIATPVATVSQAPWIRVPATNGAKGTTPSSQSVATRPLSSSAATPGATPASASMQAQASSTPVNPGKSTSSMASAAASTDTDKPMVVASLAAVAAFGLSMSAIQSVARSTASTPPPGTKSSPQATTIATTLPASSRPAAAAASTTSVSTPPAAAPPTMSTNAADATASNQQAKPKTPVFSNSLVGSSMLNHAASVAASRAGQTLSTATSPNASSVGSQPVIRHLQQQSTRSTPATPPRVATSPQEPAVGQEYPRTTTATSAPSILARSGTGLRTPVSVSFMMQSQPPASVNSSRSPITEAVPPRAHTPTAMSAAKPAPASSQAMASSATATSPKPPPSSHSADVASRPSPVSTSPLPPDHSATETPITLEVPESPDQSAKTAAPRREAAAASSAPPPPPAVAAAVAADDDETTRQLLDARVAERRSAVQSTLLAVTDRLAEMERLWYQDAQQQRALQAKQLDQSRDTTTTGTSVAGADVSALAAKLEQLRSELNAMRGGATPLQSPAVIETTQEKLQAQLNELQATLAKRDRARSEMEEDLATMAAQLKETEDERTQLRDQVKRLCVAVETGAKERAELQQDLRTLAAKYADVSAVARAVEDVKLAHANSHREFLQYKAAQAGMAKKHENATSDAQVAIKRLDAAVNTDRHDRKQAEAGFHAVRSQTAAELQELRAAIQHEHESRTRQYEALLVDIKHALAGDEA